MKTSLVYSVLITFFCSPLAVAQSNVFPTPKEATTIDTMKPHIGVRAGLSDSNQDYNGAAQFGLEVGLQPYVPFGTALELSTFSSDADSKNDLDRVQLLARGTYNFGGENQFIHYTYLGLGVGPVFDTQGDETQTRLGIAYLAGFDIPLRGSPVTRNDFSLGANLNYLTVSDSGADTLSLNGVMKYWF